MTPIADNNLDSIFRYVCERDVDLLLVDELACSLPFQRWFLRAVLDDGLPAQGIASAAVRQSVSEHGEGAGESDIIVDYELDEEKPRRIRVRIENKIDAPFQKLQVERYRTRTAKDLSSEQFDQSFCVLVAPDEYIELASEQAKKFDVIVSYEQILEFFRQRAKWADEELARRCRHKVNILEQAIHKRRRAYTAETDRQVTDFWMQYWEHAGRTARLLHMERPGPKPKGSSFVHFNRAVKSKKPLPECKIKHKRSHGRVDLEITGWADRLEELTPSFKPILDPDMELRRAGKSLAISINAPCLDIIRPFDEQQEGAQAGLDAACRLQRWFNERHQDLRQVAAQLTE